MAVCRQSLRLATAGVCNLTVPGLPHLRVAACLLLFWCSYSTQTSCLCSAGLPHRGVGVPAEARALV